MTPYKSHQEFEKQFTDLDIDLETIEEEIGETKEIVLSNNFNYEKDYFDLKMEEKKLEDEEAYFNHTDFPQNEFPELYEELKERRKKIDKEINKIKPKINPPTNPNRSNEIDNIVDRLHRYNITDLNVIKRDPILKQDYQDALDKQYELQKKINSKQFKQFLKDLFDRGPFMGFKKFAREHCQFNFLDGAKGVNLEKNTGEDKITISLGLDTITEIDNNMLFKNRLGIEKPTVYFRPDKASFLIGQALGKILSEPKNWDKIAPLIQSKIIENDGNWIDFCGICMFNPKLAEDICPEAYKLFYDRLTGINADRIKQVNNQPIAEKGDWEKLINIDTKKQTSEESADFLKNKQKWETAEKFWVETNKTSNIVFLLRFVAGMTLGGKEIRNFWLQHQQIMPDPESYKYRAIAQMEDKEISAIMLRNDSAGDRDKALRYLVGNGKEIIDFQTKFFLRSLIYADMKSSDYSSWRLHTVLQATDHLYQKTNGEMITEETYDFLRRACRMSNSAGKRMGSKIMEYEKKIGGQSYQIFEDGKLVTKYATETIYIRKDYTKWVFQVINEFKNENIRQLSGLPKEIFDQMKVDGRLENLGYARLDETYGSDLNDSNSDAMYTGRISDFMPKEFTENLLKSFNHRGAIRKLEPDQIGAMALIIFREIINEYESSKIPNHIKDNISVKRNLKIFDDVGIEPSRNRAISGEHARPFMGDAYYHFRNLFLENKEYREYINFFLVDRGIQVTGLNHETNLAEFEIIEKSKFFDPDLKDSENIYQEYAGDWQDEEIQEPVEIEEVVNGVIEKKVKDDTDNSLRDNFITNKETETAVSQLKELKKSIDYCYKQIEKLVKTSGISPEEKIYILSTILLKDSYKNNVINTDLGQLDIIYDLIVKNNDQAGFDLQRNIDRYIGNYRQLSGQIANLGAEKYLIQSDPSNPNHFIADLTDCYVANFEKCKANDQYIDDILNIKRNIMIKGKSKSKDKEQIEKEFYEKNIEIISANLKSLYELVENNKKPKIIDIDKIINKLKALEKNNNQLIPETEFTKYEEVKNLKKDINGTMTAVENIDVYNQAKRILKSTLAFLEFKKPEEKKEEGKDKKKK